MSAGRGVAVVLVGVGVLVGVSIWAQVAAGVSGVRLALDIAVGVVSWLASPLLLWRPVTGTFALTVLAALTPTATPAATVGALQVGFRRPFRTALLVGLFGVAAHVVQGMWRLSGGISFGWWTILIIVAYAAIIGWGALAQAHRALVRSLQERANRAEREQSLRVAEARALERTRIAREMHDVLAHRLSLLATYAGALEYRPDSAPEKLAEAAGIVRAGTHQALDDLRDVVAVLRDDQPDGSAPQPDLGDVASLIDESRNAGMAVELHHSVPDDSKPSPVIGRTAYRIIQEGLTNVRKHAPGQSVDVAVDGTPGSGLVIDVRNRLVDRDTTDPEIPSAGKGLIGLAERVSLAGGGLQHEITPSGQFHLRAWLPWPE